MVELNLRLAGAMIVLLALAHLFFPRWFRWGEEMAALTVLNRQIHLLHFSFIVLVLGMIGTLALGFGPALLEPTALGRLVAAGVTLFWLARLLAQVAVIDPSLWRGSRVRTALHTAALALWGYFTVTFATVLGAQLIR
jgi:hypothetical protein